MSESRACSSPPSAKFVALAVFFAIAIVLGVAYALLAEALISRRSVSSARKAERFEQWLPEAVELVLEVVDFVRDLTWSSPRRPVLVPARWPRA